MPHRRWAERVDDELGRRGVPARFRRRLLAELRDHTDDLTEGEGLTMTDETLTERLGDPAALGAAAAEEYRRARWASRHTLAVFGQLPRERGRSVVGVGPRRLDPTYTSSVAGV